VSQHATCFSGDGRRERHRGLPLDRRPLFQSATTTAGGTVSRPATAGAGNQKRRQGSLPRSARSPHATRSGRSDAGFDGALYMVTSFGQAPTKSRPRSRARPLREIRSQTAAPDRAHRRPDAPSPGAAAERVVAIARHLVDVQPSVRSNSRRRVVDARCGAEVSTGRDR